MDALSRSKERMFSPSQREVQGWSTKKRVELQRVLNSLDSVSDITLQAETINHVIKEMLTDPEFDVAENAFITSSLFEKSLYYYTADNLPETNVELMEHQIAMLDGAKQADETMYYTLLGEIAYMLHAEESDEHGVYTKADIADIKEGLIAAIEHIADQTDFSQATPDYASILNTVQTLTGDYQSLPDADAISYYASLYAHDTSLPEPLVNTDNIRIIEANRASGSSERETGIPASPHMRLYTFDQNRLPTAKSMSEGRVTLYMTEQVSTDANTREQLLHELPEGLIEVYTSYLRDKRSIDEYTNADPDTRQTLRNQYLTEFITDIVEGVESLTASIQKNVSVDELSRIKAQFRHILETPTQFSLAAAIDINK